MKWRDVIIGAVSSLAVTVAGGLIVYFATNKPDIENTERLAYAIDSVASFTGGESDVFFNSIRLINSGSQPARQVSLNIRTTDAVILDISVTTANGLQEVSKVIDNKSVSILYEDVMPQEEITVRLLLTKNESVSVDIRSKDSIGINDVSAFNANELKPKSKLNDIASKFVSIGTILTLLLSVFVFRSTVGNGIIGNRNNTGFILLHSGLPKEAEKIFRKAVESGDYSSITISNYALSKAANGDSEDAEKYIQAAKHLEPKGYPGAIVLFNEGLIDMINGHEDKGISKLFDAKSKSPKRISKYLHTSTMLEALKENERYPELMN